MVELAYRAPTLVGERCVRSSNDTHGEVKNLRFGGLRAVVSNPARTPGLRGH